jgi:hypothetical protein
MNTTLRWQGHNKILDITQMIIDEILSHEIKTDSNRLRWVLRTRCKLTQPEIQQVTRKNNVSLRNI